MQAHQEERDGTHAMQLGLLGGLHQLHSQVPEKCPLLATAPTLSLEQDGPIGFLRVIYLWANIQVGAANRLYGG